jgi:tyrosyl-DNA phosphodiesterase 2
MSKLKVLTLNVFFGHEERERRTHLLVELIMRHTPDVAALQEVTSEVFAQLEKHLSPAFHVLSEPDMGPLKPSGTCLLIARSQWPTSPMLHDLYHHELPSTDMDRTLFAVALRLRPDSHHRELTLLIGSVHLESPLGDAGTRKGNAWARRQQLRFALDKLDSCGRVAAADLCVLAGDFNSIEEEEGGWIKPPWHDIWLQLKPDDPGFTYDCDENNLAEAFRTRLDKIICCSSCRMPEVGLEEGAKEQGATATAVPESISIVGRPTPQPPPPPTEGTPPRVAKELLTSDHFGLLATFKF